MAHRGADATSAQRFTKQYVKEPGLIFSGLGKVRESGSGGKIKKTSWYSNCTVMVFRCRVGAGLRGIFGF